MAAHDSKLSMFPPSVLLQQLGQMGPLRLKNRVVMGQMGTNFGTTDGTAVRSETACGC
jgi:2,4-dienoyl-CoA reductase-like NADH-dependent reductase (Old Yellow Enzyme family)